jgi:tetratricopeptide (TPR) repeat protein
LRHGPAGEADIQIRRLEKISADDPASLALRVRWLHAQHRDAEVGPLVEAAAQRRQKASGASSAETARNCIAAGGLYELCDQYAAAERWYRRLLEVQPDNFEPLAVMLAKQKRGAEAVNVCLDAAKRSPSARPAIAVCAMRAARRIDEKEFQAAQSLVAAAEKDKPEAKFLVMLAAVRIVQERADEAIALYRQALTAEPQYVEALNNLATLLGEQPGHAQEALEFIDRAVSLAGPQGWLLETRGEILLGAGRVEEALPLVVEAASSAQPDPRVLLHLAKAYCMAGKLDQARKALDDARKRNLSQHMLTPAQRKLIQELDEKLRG